MSNVLTIMKSVLLLIIQIKSINFQQNKTNCFIIIEISRFFLSYNKFWIDIMKYMKTKTIIISSQKEASNARGILTIFSENGMLNCRIRLYNVQKMSKFCKLGIYHESEVFSGNLVETDGVFTCSILGNFDIDKDFYSAIVDTSCNNDVVLAGGTYAGYYFNDNSVFEDLTYDNEVDSIINSSSEDEPLEEEHVTTHNCDRCEKCANCEYKKYFFEHLPSESSDDFLSNNNSKQLNEDIKSIPNEANSNTVLDESVSQISNKASSQLNDHEINQPQQTEPHANADLFSSIVPQFKYVFDNYEANSQLNELIPNSKFVSICEGNDNYSIGAIYDNEQIKYLCYAVLKESSVYPPPELGEHYQWLPLDREDPLSEGYFIVFQDATDLKIVEL